MGQLIQKIRTEAGDLQIDYAALANLPESDATLSQAGAFADAKMTGDKIQDVNTKIDNIMHGTSDIPAISVDSFTLDGSPVERCDLTMGSVATGKVLSTQGAIDLAHTHTVILNDDGSVTLGEVSSKGGQFPTVDPNRVVTSVNGMTGDVIVEQNEVLPISKGGTDATTPVGARENLLMVVSAEEPKTPTAGMLWFDIS